MTSSENSSFCKALKEETQLINKRKIELDLVPTNMINDGQEEEVAFDYESSSHSDNSQGMLNYIIIK